MATNETAAYSFAQACAILNVAPATLRKRIRDGSVRAQRVERPQGYSWLVFLEGVPANLTSSVTSNEAADVPSHQTSKQPAADPVDGQQLALALAPLVEASVSAAVAPLRAELTDVRALLSERDQEVGQLRAVLAHVLEDRSRSAAGAVDESPKRAPWWAVWRWATST